MVEIISAHTESLPRLIHEFNAAKISSGTELRAKDEGETLYTKSKFSKPILNKAEKEERTEQQKKARALISSALDQHFTDKNEKEFIPVVKKNLRSIFEGSGKVTRGDFDKVKQEADRVQNTYSEYSKSKTKYESNPDYQTGITNFKEVLTTTPGFNKDMDKFECFDLYVKLLKKEDPPSADTLKQMGALVRHILELNSEVQDKTSIQRSDDAMKLASQHGAESSRPLPQDVALRHFGNTEDREGRCLPFVSLVALTESRASGGGDGVFDRIEQETAKMSYLGSRERNDYALALVDIHNSGKLSASRSTITDSSGTAVGGIGHRAALQHMLDNPDRAAGKPVFYGIEVKDHIMMAGVTKHGGKESFVFYDPNIGMARFPSAEKLQSFMDDYFGKLGYGETYSMKDTGKDGFGFTVVKQFDLDKLGAVKLEDGSSIATLGARRTE